MEYVYRIESSTRQIWRNEVKSGHGVGAELTEAQYDSYQVAVASLKLARDNGAIDLEQWTEAMIQLKATLFIAVYHRFLETSLFEDQP